MSEQAYRAIYERAREKIEKAGEEENPFDVLGPVQPGTAAARAGYERFGLKMRLPLAAEADTGFDFLGKKLRSPIMTASMSENTLGRHRRDAFREVAEGSTRFGTQYWIGDCEDETWKEVAAVSPSAVRIVKPWRERERVTASLKLAEDTGAFAVGMDFESCFYNEECAPQTLDALDEYVSATDLPFVFKAVGSAESARVARDAGASAVIVTTHGGAHGPSWGHPLEILPEVVREAGDDVLVLAESGVRRGEDVLKLLARGADGVLAGRGLVLGLFAGGAEGVAQMLELLNEELERTMLMAGCPDLASISEEILIRR